MKGEILTLDLSNDALRGELGIDLPPGTVAAARDRAIDALLAARLEAIAAEAGVVLAAAPSAYAHPLAGKDESGRTRFELRGRVEGDRLIPSRNAGRERGRR